MSDRERLILPPLGDSQPAVDDARGMLAAMTPADFTRPERAGMQEAPGPMGTRRSALGKPRSGNGGQIPFRHRTPGARQEG